jgi:hypothetical protein
MNKLFTRLFFSLALLTGLFTLMPASSQGQSTQPVIVRPTEIYRFVISFSDGGYLLTGNFQEGVANGYTPEQLPLRANRGNFAYSGLYMPPPGYTPDPSVGLVPLHRWLVIQSGWRNYYYYSTYYSALGGDYHYQGIAGYVFPPGTATFRGQPLSQMSTWYSQLYGYWNGVGVIPGDAGFYIEPPPHSSYAFHGAICAMPGAVTGTRYPPSPFVPTIFDVFFYPPPPPPSCNPTQEQACYDNGGNWNSTNCTCSYLPPDPCRQGAEDLGGDKPTKGASERPPLPCRAIEQ